METKATINLNEGTVDLAGSEEFVSKYLDIFKEMMTNNKSVHNPPNAAPPKHQESEEAKEKKQSASSKKSNKPTKTKSIAIEKFDIHKDASNVSLEEFLEQKNPGKSTANIIAVVAYYITHIKGADSFSEGNIDYAYRTVPIPGRPAHLRQIIINAKNKQDFFDSNGDDGRWKVTRTCEIFVEEKLPPKNPKHK